MNHPLLEKAGKRTIIFDGAMGTLLMAAGLPAGESPELWNLEKASVVAEIHRQYYEAGADVVHTNTFGANPVKLGDKGLSDRMELINTEAVRIVKGVCPEGRFVAGDLGPTGKLLKPLGEASPEEVEEGYDRQAQALISAGVDLISIETMFSLEEALCAVRGAKKTGGLPVSVCMTYNRTKNGYFTMMGESATKCVSALEQAGADIIGTNCNLVSGDMIDLAREIRKATQKRVLIQPNAGKPSIQKGITVYAQLAEEFARDAKEIREAGADMIGGCCGTTPEFIRCLVEKLKAACTT